MAASDPAVRGAPARTSRRRWRLALALACAVAVGCGGSASAPDEPDALPPVDPRALAKFDDGLRARRRGGPKAEVRAERHFEAAVAIDATLWEGWHNLGVVRLALGDPQGAAEAFSRALSVNPRHRASRLGRAEARVLAGSLSGAREDYGALLDRDPDDLEAATRLVSLLRDAGRHGEAIDTIRAYLREAGATAPIYVQLGLVYHTQGRTDLAELVLDKAGELDADDPSVYNALALVALSRGEDQQAFDLFDRATALDPGYLDARFNKASVLLDAGDYDRALPELREVARAEPDDLDARVALGVALRGTEKLEKAREVWKDVVKRARPGTRAHADALYNLAILELDFFMELDAAKVALDRYLQQAGSDHPKREEAEQRRKELGL